MKSAISIATSQSATPAGTSHKATTQGALTIGSLADGVALSGSSQAVGALTNGLLGSHGSTAQASEFNLLATPAKVSGMVTLASSGAGELASLTQVLSTLAPATTPASGLLDAGKSALAGLPVLGDVVKTATAALPSVDSLPTLGAQTLGGNLSVAAGSDLPSLAQLASSSPVSLDDLSALLPGLPTGNLLSHTPVDPSSLLNLLSGLPLATALPPLPTTAGLPDLTAVTGLFGQLNQLQGSLPAVPGLDLPSLPVGAVGPEAIISQAQGAVGTLQSTVAGLHLLG